MIIDTLKEDKAKLEAARDQALAHYHVLQGKVEAATDIIAYMERMAVEGVTPELEASENGKVPA